MKKFSITATLWIYPGENATWHFLTIPKDISEIIKSTKPAMKRGWGSVQVSVAIGKTKWDTSIFPDKRSGTYILPVKAKVRQAEGLYDGDSVSFSVALV